MTTFREGVQVEREDVLDTARAILAEVYSGAAAAVVAGSRLRREDDASSDLDLVVLYATLPHAHCETFLWRGGPVEAFVHDPETLGLFLESEAAAGRPVMIQMMADGAIVGPEPSAAASLAAEAARLLAAGPSPLDAAAVRILRYRITDLLDDLRAPRDCAEIRAIGCALHELLAELALRGRRRWSARGQWIPRALEAVDPGLAERFDAAFGTLFGRCQPDLLLALATDELQPHGGRLFTGDRRDAPPACRRRR